MIMPAAPTAPPPAPAVALKAAPAPAPSTPINPLAAPLGTGSMAKALEGLAGLSDKPSKMAPKGPKAEPPKSPEPAKDVLKEPAKEPEQPKIDDELENEPAKDEGKGVKADAQEPTSTETDKGKKDPWKLVNTYKDENKTLKTKFAALEKEYNDHKAKPVEDLKPKLEEVEKRAERLERELQFVRYEKSEDFTTKYQKPYEEAFSKAVSDLRGIQAQFEQNGEVQTRAIDESDIAQLAALPPDRARQLIKQMFPEDHEEVKAHIKEVRRLSESRTKALDDAKKNSGEQAKQYEQHMRSIQEHATKTLEKVTAENATKFEFLKSVEGDDEHNGALTKAKEMVLKGISRDALDPRITPEEREDIIRQQASIRDRAIAYSTLKLANKRKDDKIAELEKALKEYQGSEPGAGDRSTKSNGAPIPPGGQLNAALDGLSKYAQ